jgi:4a-hydroxytetrahydrobiopterin dehydratase
MELAEKKCVPCKGGTPPLSAKQIEPLLAQVPGWSLRNGHLYQSLKFKDWAGAIDFVNAISEVAEEQGHHPDLYVSWGKVAVELWTHKIEGLTESDFIMAAKIDRAHDDSATTPAAAPFAG